MSININNNIITGITFDTSSNIIGPSIYANGLILWLDAGNTYSIVNSSNYYNCGYGCQYYSSNPGCVNCNGQWNDMSGRGNDAILSGATVGYSTYGTHINFNGSSHYAVCISSTELKPTTYLTIELWVNFSSTSGTQALISRQYSTSFDKSYQIYNVDGTVYYGVRTSSFAGHGDWTIPSTGVWYHTAMVYNGSNVIVYVDGDYVAQHSKTGSITYQTNRQTTIGCSNEGSGTDVGKSNFINGNMGIIRMYERALSGPEIFSNYCVDRIRFGK